MGYVSNHPTLDLSADKGRFALYLIHRVYSPWTMDYRLPLTNENRFLFRPALR